MAFTWPPRELNSHNYDRSSYLLFCIFISNRKQQDSGKQQFKDIVLNIDSFKKKFTMINPNNCSYIHVYYTLYSRKKFKFQNLRIVRGKK